MIKKDVAKKIAQIVLEAKTVEEIAFRFAASGLNFPEDPFSRCRLLAGYTQYHRARRDNIVAASISAMAKSIRNSGNRYMYYSSRKAILDKVDAYAAESVNLTDQQANQIFYELVYAAKSVAAWRRLALARYWKKKGKQAWRA